MVKKSNIMSKKGQYGPKSILFRQYFNDNVCLINCYTKVEIMVFNKDITKAELENAIANNSEHQLLEVLKKNSFLFYDLYSRKFGIQPNFSEVPFGSKYRCDFCWLNDNSDGPEWVLVEIEKPDITLFKANGDPTYELNHAIEQVKSWERYFQQNPLEKSRIFGAVSRFRLILVVGTAESWQEPIAASWRAHNNSTSTIEIRSMNSFSKSLAHYNEKPENLSFEEHPKSMKSSDLSTYCRDYSYLIHWKNVLTSNV